MRTELEASLKQEPAAASSSADNQTLLSVLKKASSVLQRPVWVFTSLAAASCVCEVGNAELDPQRVAPLRLAQLGGSFFPTVSLSTEADVEVIEVIEADPVQTDDALAVEGEGEGEGEVQLPDLKEDLASTLTNVVALGTEVEQWSKQHFNTSLDLTTYKKPLSDYQERLRTGDGLDGALIGDNGVGKSTLVNLSVFNTLSDESTYAAGLERAPEAVRELLSGNEQEPPPLRKLLEDGTVPGYDESKLSVQLLSAYAAAPAAAPAAFDVEMDPAGAARRKHEELESSIRKYAEVEGQTRPKVSDFLLPCGQCTDSTTAVHTRVRSGGTIHALVEFASEAELQQQAYQFVQLRRELGDDDPEDLDDDNLQKEELKQAWHTYIGVKEGTVRANDLPDFGDDFPDADELEESWSSIQVCEALREVVKSQYILYLGGGTDFHLDRKHAHDLLWRLNDKEQLQRLAAKSIEVFVPAGVLEGGSSFVDLPGLNDVDGRCLVQTVEGLQRAGVVFVVLKKSLSVDKSTVKLLEASGLLRRVVQNNDIEVVFIFNRETDQQLQVGHIDTEEEATNRSELEKATRELWKKLLIKVNKQLVKANESSRTETEIDEMVKKTQCRTIYPMTHTAFKLNVEHADAHKEQAAAIFRTSNVYWLLGSLEALNRDGYVRELERIVTVTLPGLRGKLQSSLDDVVALNQGAAALPEPLIKMAETWLQQTRSLNSGFGHVHSSLEEKVKGLTTGSESVKARLGKMVHDFMSTDDSVKHFLQKARTNQPASCRDLVDRITKKGYVGALKVIDPIHKGAYRTLEIMPVAFGSKNNQVQVDFQPLIDSIEAMLQEVKEKVIDQILSSVDIALKDAGIVKDAGIDTDASVRILQESFTTSDVLSTMDQRFHNFFSAKQHASRLKGPFSLSDDTAPRLGPLLSACRAVDLAVDPVAPLTPPQSPLSTNRHAVALKNNRPADYFKKVAVQMRVTALHAKVLSKHDQAQSLQGVCKLITDNLDETREEWKRRVTSGLASFIGTQFTLLFNDLIGNKGLLKSLLRGFLQHIVQTSRMQGDDELQQHLRRFLRDLQQQSNAAHALWTRLIKRDDAEELGRAAAQHVERKRRRQMIQRRAGSFNLGDPAERMALLQLLPHDMPTGFVSTQTFLVGDLNNVPTLNQQVLTQYKRGVCKTGRPDLFSAFAMVVWGKRSIKERLSKDKDGKPVQWLDALTTAAKQLRAICISQIRHHFRKTERRAKIETTLCEPLEQYITRLDEGDYNGDALCLFFLADHFKQHFVLWLPDGKPIFFSPEMSCVPSMAHHLVLAAEAPTTTTPAASYKPVWFFFQDDRKVKFDGKTDVQLVATTDDEVSARRSVRPSTDFEKVDVVRKRPNPDGTVGTYVDGAPIGAAPAGSSSGKRPRAGP